MKLSTINQIVEALCAEGRSADANQAVIFYNMVLISEKSGIDAAMGYFHGTHTSEEYQEYRTGIVLPEE